LSHYFDSSLLKDEKGRAEMLQAWEGELPKPLNDLEWAPWLEAATKKVLACNTRLAKERRHLRGVQVRVHAKKIQLAEEQLQRDPTNEQVREILSESQAKLAEIFQTSIERNTHLTAAKWFRYGDTCSKTFFDFHRIGKKKTLLKELEVDGETISDQKDLSHYITKFYANLYESESHAPGTSEAQERCWESVPTRVTEAMNANMTQSLSLAKITEAITLLPKGKAPGHDGIPTEFFQEYVNEVAPTLLLAFKPMLARGLTSEYINKGMITLIPKSGDHSKLGNWRPITLLGSIYKILAKILARRIQEFLPLVIRPNQTGFVEGRSILDNNFLAQEALVWAPESGQDLVLLLLDFEKAFDRIEWDFLFPTLSKLGFCPTWIQWISSLY
jgi:hypothetical protein